MNHSSRFCLLAVFGIAVVLAGPAAAQPMLTFPEDTIIAEGCEDIWALDTRLFGLNLTNEPFTLHWVKIQEEYPTGGFTGLIIDGLQYPPSLTGGDVDLGGEDSVEVVFETYSQHPLTPGDSVIYQIEVFNPEDSHATTMQLTCIVVCPETTRTQEAERPPGISVFPNPANGDVTFLSDASVPGARFDIYTNTGRRVHSAPVAEDGARMDVQDWPAGVYIVCLVRDSRILDRRTLVVTP